LHQCYLRAGWRLLLAAERDIALAQIGVFDALNAVTPRYQQYCLKRTKAAQRQALQCTGVGRARESGKSSGSPRSKTAEA